MHDDEFRDMLAAQDRRMTQERNSRAFLMTVAVALLIVAGVVVWGFFSFR